MKLFRIISVALIAAACIIGTACSPVKSLRKKSHRPTTATTTGSYTPPVYKQDPTIMAGEASNMVSRDKPGQTALERTIIRWYFDSDPRGARIYWRVISSIPSIVKNTNETYLMTTPFEETRSFNILGLTYENSRDGQQKGIRRSDQAIQCPPGHRPTGDQRLLRTGGKAGITQTMLSG